MTEQVTTDDSSIDSAASALSAGLGAAPCRAVRLTLALEADSLLDLVDALDSIALRIDRSEMTAGCSGGYGSGYTYELLQNPAQTHERYFAELRKHLAEKTPNAKSEPTAPLLAQVGSTDGLGVAVPPAPTFGDKA